MAIEANAGRGQERVGQWQAVKDLLPHLWTRIGWDLRTRVGAAVVSGFAAVGSKVPAHPEWANSPKIHLIVMEGISESLAGGILGFCLLSLTWMVMAVGHRRLGRELPVS